MQVWFNLIGNAIKFSHHNGRISISLKSSGKNIVVKVRDQGIGMSEETRLHIFEKFYQGSKSRSEDGNGLGLPLVRRILDLSGGKISVESEENVGSEFTVTLKK
jgi:signal transduction histidine kinase